MKTSGIKKMSGIIQLTKVLVVAIFLRAISNICSANVGVGECTNVILYTYVVDKNIATCNCYGRQFQQDQIWKKYQLDMSKTKKLLAYNNTRLIHLGQCVTTLMSNLKYDKRVFVESQSLSKCLDSSNNSIFENATLDRQLATLGHVYVAERDEFKTEQTELSTSLNQCRMEKGNLTYIKLERTVNCVMQVSSANGSVFNVLIIYMKTEEMHVFKKISNGTQLKLSGNQMQGMSALVKSQYSDYKSSIAQKLFDLAVQSHLYTDAVIIVKEMSIIFGSSSRRGLSVSIYAMQENQDRFIDTESPADNISLPISYHSTPLMDGNDKPSTNGSGTSSASSQGNSAATQGQQQTILHHGLNGASTSTSSGAGGNDGEKPPNSNGRIGGCKDSTVVNVEPQQMFMDQSTVLPRNAKLNDNIQGEHPLRQNPQLFSNEPGNGILIPSRKPRSAYGEQPRQSITNVNATPVSVEDNGAQCHVEVRIPGVGEALMQGGDPNGANFSVGDLSLLPASRGAELSQSSMQPDLLPPGSQYFPRGLDLQPFPEHPVPNVPQTSLGISTDLESRQQLFPLPECQFQAQNTPETVSPQLQECTIQNSSHQSNDAEQETFSMSLGEPTFTAVNFALDHISGAVANRASSDIETEVPPEVASTDPGAGQVLIPTHAENRPEHDYWSSSYSISPRRRPPDPEASEESNDSSLTQTQVRIQGTSVQVEDRETSLPVYIDLPNTTLSENETQRPIQTQEASTSVIDDETNLPIDSGLPNTTSSRNEAQEQELAQTRRTTVRVRDEGAASMPVDSGLPNTTSSGNEAQEQELAQTRRTTVRVRDEGAASMPVDSGLPNTTSSGNEAQEQELAQTRRTTVRVRDEGAASMPVDSGLPNTTSSGNEEYEGLPYGIGETRYDAQRSQMTLSTQQPISRTQTQVRIQGTSVQVEDRETSLPVYIDLPNTTLSENETQRPIQTQEASTSVIDDETNLPIDSGLPNTTSSRNEAQEQELAQTRRTTVRVRDEGAASMPVDSGLPNTTSSGNEAQEQELAQTRRTTVRVRDEGAASMPVDSGLPNTTSSGNEAQEQELAQTRRTTVRVRDEGAASMPVDSGLPNTTSSGNEEYEGLPYGIGETRYDAQRSQMTLSTQQPISRPSRSENPISPPGEPSTIFGTSRFPSSDIAAVEAERFFFHAPFGVRRERRRCLHCGAFFICLALGICQICRLPWCQACHNHCEDVPAHLEDEEEISIHPDEEVQNRTL